MNVLSKLYEILPEEDAVRAETCRKVLIKTCTLYVFYDIICFICNIEFFSKLVVNIFSLDLFV